jgi:CcmD family protein
MENLGYLCAAYPIIFAAVILYVTFLWRRQVRLDSRLRRLETELKELRDQLTGDQSTSATRASGSLS